MTHISDEQIRAAAQAISPNKAFVSAFRQGAQFILAQPEASPTSAPEGGWYCSDCKASAHSCRLPKSHRWTASPPAQEPPAVQEDAIKAARVQALEEAAALFDKRAALTNIVWKALAYRDNADAIRRLVDGSKP